MDSRAIADALVSRFGPVTPPAGAEAVKLATSELPDNLTLYPTVLVLPPRIDRIDQNASRNRSFTMTYPVVFYLSRADGTPRRAAAIHDWLTVLYGQTGGQLQLGLDYVAIATVETVTAGGVTYGGESYDGITLTVGVRISESYVPAA